MRFQIWILFLSLFVRATASALTAVPTSVAPLPMNEKTKWSVSLSADQLLPTNEAFDPRTDFSLSGSYKFNKKHSLQAIQGFSKNYIIDRTQQEWPINDTLMYYYYTPEMRPFDIGLKWRGSATLPISETSQRTNVLSVLGLALIFDHSFFENKLTLKLNPSARYQINRYTTTVSGRPLKKWTAGMSLTALYQLTDQLSLSSVVAGNNVWVERTQFTQGEQSQDSSYSFSLGASYDITSQLSTSLAYSQNANAMNEGRYEIFAYDPNASEFTFGIAYTF
jgi:long-subunit fatty acid transport protein